MYIKKTALCFFIASVLSVFISSVSEASEEQAACTACHEAPSDVLKQEHPTAQNFSECLQCHEAGTEAGSLGDKIHLKHTESMGTSEETCLNCHKDGGGGKIVILSKNKVVFDKADMADLIEKYSSWSSSEELADSHKTAGVGCSACHTDYSYDDSDVVSEKCTACHGSYEELAPKTADKHRNPHKSHYSGLSCARCHQVHEPFFDYCDKCHHTDMKWNKKVK